MKQLSYKHTITASYVGYCTQAIVNHFYSLLFLTFQSEYCISIEQISMFISVNFGTQLLTDLFSACFVDRIGYRKCLVVAHFLVGFGLWGMTLFPDLLPNAFLGLLISCILCAVGGGLIEVVVSPVVKNCPTSNKTAHMSLLHSFYCWGIVGTVLLSTLFFSCFGLEKWRILSRIWSVVPFMNAVCFALVPIEFSADAEKAPTCREIRTIGTIKVFYLLAIFMLCAGACELAIGQWVSVYAEAGLRVGKTVGDLAGPCMFALLMGIARALSSHLTRKISVVSLMIYSSGLCILAYLLTALSPIPILSLIGTALCGFSVGVLWPGTYSIAGACCPQSGTTLFALLALAGDIGCICGPLIVGVCSDFFHGRLDIGILVACVFPILMFTTLCFSRKTFKCEKLNR